MKFLAKLGEKLYLKHATQRESLDRLFRMHIGDRTETTHAEFKKLSDGEKQEIFLECQAFVKNPTFRKIFQWELEEQSIDTMRGAENDFQFLVGKMSVYAADNLLRRFKLYAGMNKDYKPEDFDRLSPL